MWVQPVRGEQVLAYSDGIRRTYAEAFAGPPWHEDPAMADGYAERLAEDAKRPGFVAAVVLSRDAHDVRDVCDAHAARDARDTPADAESVVGFATAWTTPDPFPASRGYSRVSAALGPARTADWLVGAIEVDELALGPRARGAGLAAALLESVTAAAPEGRCWLLTSARAEPALRLYRRLGWRPAFAPVEGSDLVAFLGPDHPAPRRRQPPL
ncbi:GNAT family N-acetyltransferase [Streptomyces sp. NPDC058382]|uniref:GNAT family N-acetyltransferase n=1 Tax=unclassified Streptomyces TaxID=2593676 RepID=UPI0036336BB4